MLVKQAHSQGKSLRLMREKWRTSSPVTMKIARSARFEAWSVPQSHASSVAWMPLPHTALVQTSGLGADAEK